MDLVRVQLLTAAHEAQHFLALDLAFPFSRGLRLRLLAFGSGVEELGQDLKAWIGVRWVACQAAAMIRMNFKGGPPPSCPGSAVRLHAVPQGAPHGIKKAP